MVLITPPLTLDEQIRKETLIAETQWDTARKVGFWGGFFVAYAVEKSGVSMWFSITTGLVAWAILCGFYYRELRETLKAHQRGVTRASRD